LFIGKTGKDPEASPHYCDLKQEVVGRNRDVDMHGVYRPWKGSKTGQDPSMHGSTIVHRCLELLLPY